MMTKQTAAKEKKPYQKPEIEVIDLAAEEVMAVGCKTTVSRGTGAPSQPNCILAHCAANGS
jgi:hypothetical protein